MRFILMSVLGLIICGCAQHSAEERRLFRNPLTGTDTLMRVVHIGNVDVTVPEDDPSTMVLISVGGSSVAGIACGAANRCEVSAFEGRNIGAGIQVSPDGNMPMAVQYFGKDWSVWDHNGRGQPDMRIARGTKVVEIWIDGTWREQRSSGTGKDRKYYIGDREVSLTANGWKYVGT